jgi:branched-chain amino acid aminotransferase
VFHNFIEFDFSTALGVAASDSAILYVILSPTGPYFRGEVQGLSLLSVGKSVRAWPGGTGDHKLGLNYAPAFLPQRIAAKQGYQQILWLLGEESRITEAGAMNFFAVVKRDDDGMNLFFSFFTITDSFFFDRS